jgi:RNA polymerase sigma factor (sigma-70 family)
MGTNRATILRHLRTLVAAGHAEAASDRELLRRFSAARDEDAFEALVRRHGSMVLSLCRRVLGNLHDAEDASQAVFLLLAQKASCVHWRESVIGWLHKAAVHTSLKLQTAIRRRARREGRLTPKPAPDPLAELTVRELQRALDEELARLPDKYRSVLLLCCLQGRTRDEAAQQLGWTLGQVKDRLELGREKLHRRLAQRGLVLSTALATLVLTREGLAATFARATCQAALRLATGGALASGISPAVTLLVKGANRAMWLTKLKVSIALLVTSSLLATGFVGLARHIKCEAPESQPAPPAGLQGQQQSPPDHAGQRPASKARAQDGTIGGRVVDPDGNPVARVRVALHKWRDNAAMDSRTEPAVGVTDADGCFRLSSLDHVRQQATDGRALMILTAQIPGHGPAVTAWGSSPEELNNRTLRLVKDDVPLQGRVCDLEGRPIAGVSVRAVTILTNLANDLGPLLKARAQEEWSNLAVDYRPIDLEAASVSLDAKAVTKADGRFRLSGFGRERVVILRVDGPTVETRLFQVMTREGPAPRATLALYCASFDYAVAPGLVVEGTISDQDTGKPLTGVTVRHRIPDGYGSDQELTTTSDTAGSYRLGGLLRRPGQTLEFTPQTAAPYFAARQVAPVPDFGKPAKLDVAMKRGILVKGRVSDKETGAPLQATIQCFPFLTNPNLRGLMGFAGSQAVSSKTDGSFTVVALPGPGVIAARAKQGPYLSGQGAEGIPGFRAEENFFRTAPSNCAHWKFNTLAAIDPGRAADAISCDLQLIRGMTVKGTVLDSGGKPLTGAGIDGPFGSMFSVPSLASTTFTIEKVDPSRAQPYFFHHHERKLAAVVLLKGDEPDGFTVKLTPSAKVIGRLVNEDGEPIRNADITGRIEPGQLNLTRGWIGFFSARTDRDGRFNVDGLCPGCKLSALVGRENQVPDNVFTSQTFKPGEVRDLGNVTVKLPPE